MAFPDFRDIAVATNGTGASSSPVITLPTTVEPGDLLLVVFRVAVGGVVGWPANWVELFDASSDAADDQMAAAWKLADGTEGGTTITLSCTSGKFAAVAWAIKDAADPTITPPELSTVATGTSASQPNATTVTPTGGAKDYLYGTFCGMEGEATVPPTYPSLYSGGEISANSGSGGAVTTNVRVAGAWRQLNATSADPGAFTFAGTLDDWTAYAIAVHPAPSIVPKGTLTLTGLVPSLAFGLAMTVGTLSLAGQPVGVGFRGPDPGSLIFTGSVPTVVVGSGSGTITVPAGVLTFTGYAPENLIQGGGTIIVPAGALALTGEAIEVAFTGPAVGRLTLTGYAPTVSQSGLGAAITVPAGSLTLTGYLVEPVFLGPAPGTLTLTGYAPFVLFNNDVLIQIPVRALVLTGLTPAVATGNTTITIPVRALTLTGLAPTLAFQGGSITLQVPAGALVVAGQQPNPRVDVVQVFSLTRALQQCRLG